MGLEAYQIQRALVLSEVSAPRALRDKNSKAKHQGPNYDRIRNRRATRPSKTQSLAEKKSLPNFQASGRSVF